MYVIAKILTDTIHQVHSMVMFQNMRGVLTRMVGELLDRVLQLTEGLLVSFTRFLLIDV